MKVYLAYQYREHGATWTMGVYSTRELAQQRVALEQKFEPGTPDSYVTYGIHERLLDPPIEELEAV